MGRGERSPPTANWELQLSDDRCRPLPIVEISVTRNECHSELRFRLVELGTGVICTRPAAKRLGVVSGNRFGEVR